MPHKKSFLTVPAWVDALKDECLKTTVIEALVARKYATDHGAEDNRNCAAALRSADVTLDNIESGKLSGKPAWKKAADALRKYNTAGECAYPTATRR